jgi:hypothetical protein
MVTRNLIKNLPQRFIAISAPLGHQKTSFPEDILQVPANLEREKTPIQSLDFPLQIVTFKVEGLGEIDDPFAG